MKEMNMTRHDTPARIAILAYGLVAYASFHAAFLYLILFLADAFVPYTLASNASLPLFEALGIDAALVALFGLQHTIMARPAFKRWWTRLLPAPMERSTFVLATVACLAVIMTSWIPVSGSLWRVDAPIARFALFAVQGIGWAIVVWSTFLIDHWELFGVRQVLSNLKGATVAGKTFRTPSLYRYVRHPMMVGMLLGLWITPDMSASRLVFAAGFTCYVMFGVRIEERDLVVALGEEYRLYQERVPRLLPGLGRL
jgi:protein-S-isoprenylcysteine O-methyltransferase Ste14